MSAPAFAWALEQGARLNLLAADRLVLIYLADLANGEKVCWPGLGLIETYTGLSPNTVRTAIHRLADMQLIRVEIRSGYTNRYHILRDVTTSTGGNGAHAPPPKHACPSPQDAPTLPPQTVGGDPPQTIPPPSPQIVQEGGRHDLRIPPPNRAPDPKKEPRKERKKGRAPLNPPQAGGGDFVPPWFDAFWDNYPRKVGKRTATAAFIAAVKRGNDPAVIVAGLRGYRFHADPRFQPHPTTWLRGDRWLDEPAAPVLSVTDQIRKDWGLTSFLTPDFDDEMPPPGRLLS